MEQKNLQRVREFVLNYNKCLYREKVTFLPENSFYSTLPLAKYCSTAIQMDHYKIHMFILDTFDTISLFFLCFCKQHYKHIVY